MFCYHQHLLCNTYIYVSVCVSFLHLYIFSHTHICVSSMISMLKRSQPNFLIWDIYSVCALFLHLYIFFTHTRVSVCFYDMHVEKFSTQPKILLHKKKKNSYLHPFSTKICNENLLKIIKNRIIFFSFNKIKEFWAFIYFKRYLYSNLKKCLTANFKDIY